MIKPVQICDMFQTHLKVKTKIVHLIILTMRLMMLRFYGAFLPSGKYYCNMANIVFQWMLVACTQFMHPFFVSMTDLNLNNKTHTLEVSERIFTDDFENTLRKNYPGKIDILHPQNQQQMNDFVADYIRKHLQIKVNGKAVELKFAGYEQEEESIWAYFEISNISAVQRIDINNSVLHDYNNNQINIIHVKVNDQEKSLKLDYPATNAVFEF